jgi:Fe-S cluster assembly protein SufB
MDAGMAAEGLSPLADHADARLGQAEHSADRLSGRLLLGRAQEEGWAEELDEVDPEILRVYEKLGIPLAEQEVLAGVEGARKVAVDAVFDSVSVATTFRKELEAAGVIFRSISEAIREYPELVKKWLGRWCRWRTTSSPRSTARCFPTARLSTCPKACAARWSCPPISASTRKTPASSNAR